MQKIFTFISLVLLNSTINLFSQVDSKVEQLYQKKQYVKCIERCDKLLKKERKNLDLQYYKALSFYELYKNPDIKSDINNPLKKSLNTITKIYSSNSNYPDNQNLKVKITAEYIKLYQIEAQQENWNKAYAYITDLYQILPERVIFIHKARCEYFLDQPSNAIESISSALKETNYSNANVLFKETYLLLKELETKQKIKQYLQLLDTLISYFPKEEKLSDDFIKQWNQIYQTCNVDSVMNYTIKLSMKAGNLIGLKEHINKTLERLFDSLITIYEKDNTQLQALFDCVSLLYKVRLTSNNYLSINGSRFYQLSTQEISLNVKEYSFDWWTISFGCKTKNSDKLSYITFDIRKNWKNVPTVILYRTGELWWKDAPKGKRATSPKDIVKKETYNSLLLDTLTLRYCNELRKQNGRKPLAWDNQDLYRMAKHHARVQCLVGNIFHGEPLDSNLADIDSIRMYMKNLEKHGRGENCQRNSVDHNITYDELARQFIKIWETSPGHRANMLNDNYDRKAVHACILDQPHAQVALFHPVISKKYFPEYVKLLEILPSLKKELLRHLDTFKVNMIYLSQNFSMY